MKSIVMYRADCTDGFGAAFAAWSKLGDDAKYIPMRYGQVKTVADMNHVLASNNVPAPDDGTTIYILDFSFSLDVMEWLMREVSSVIWLDHHKTAFEMWCDGIPASGRCVVTKQHEDDPQPHHIMLDNNKSGALLAWEYFHPGAEIPKLIQRIDDRDRWQFALPNSKEIHAFLQSCQPWTFEKWARLIDAPESVWNGALLAGEGILRTQNQHVQQMAKNFQKCKIWSHCGDPHDERNLFEYEGLAVNACLHQSELGHELANQSGTYGLIWHIGQDGRAKCSLRSNGDYDVSAIAKTFGGGGHRNAAGFETDVQTILAWLG